jgi:hypothetical protein
MWVGEKKFWAGLVVRRRIRFPCTIRFDALRIIWLQAASEPGELVYFLEKWACFLVHRCTLFVILPVEKQSQLENFPTLALKYPAPFNFSMSWIPMCSNFPFQLLFSKLPLPFPIFNVLDSHVSQIFQIGLVGLLHWNSQVPHSRTWCTPCRCLATVGALDQLSLWARGGLYVSSLDQTLTFQSLAKWALANMNYYTNLAHAPGIVPHHASL